MNKSQKEIIEEVLKEIDKIPSDIKIEMSPYQYTLKAIKISLQLQREEFEKMIDEKMQLMEIALRMRRDNEEVLFNNNQIQQAESYKLQAEDIEWCLKLLLELKRKLKELK